MLAQFFAAPAEHFRKTMVAMQEAVLAGKGHAQRGIVEDGLVLEQQLLLRLVGLLALGDVFRHEDRTVARVTGIDRTAEHAAPEDAAVTALHLQLGVQTRAAGENAGCLLAQGIVGFLGRKHDGSRLAKQIVARPAEHFGKALVAVLENSLTRKGDTERCVIEDRLVFQQRLARPAVAVR